MNTGEFPYVETNIRQIIIFIIAEIDHSWVIIFSMLAALLEMEDLPLITLIFSHSLECI